MEALEDEFGDIIQKARTGNGLTLKEVSKKTLIPLLMLEEMEACHHKPSREEMDSLALVTGLNPVKLKDLVFGEWHPEKISCDALPGILAVDGYVGSYKVKGYILADKEGGEAVAFDTANDSRKMLACLEERGLRLKYIFLTHCHADHLGGLEEMCRATGAMIGIPGGESSPLLEPDIRNKIFQVEDGSEYEAASAVVKAIATPGHTSGSTSYVTPYGCFSGDALFAGSVGRVFKEERYRTLLHSVKTRLLSLEEGMHIFPGHGPATTVGEEIRHNPFF